jgi:hypothetical protein
MEMNVPESMEKTYLKMNGSQHSSGIVIPTGA